MTPQVGIAGAGGERHRPMCPAAGNRAALLGEWGDHAGHCDVGSQREGERGGQHARLRVISARRPAGASGSLPQKPEGLADDRQGARGTGVTGGLQEGTGDRAGVAGGLRGTSVHTARASSSSEAEAACFAWMDLRPGGWDHVVPPFPWRWLRAQLWRPLGSVC